MLFGYPIKLHYAPAWQPLWKNFLLMDNWHLFWYLAIAAFALSLPRLFAPAYQAMTVLMLAAFSFLIVVFFFTQAQAWAEDFTTLNRAFLHMIPALLFYIMLLLREAAALSGGISSAQKNPAPAIG